MHLPIGVGKQRIAHLCRTFLIRFAPNIHGKGIESHCKGNR